MMASNAGLASIGSQNNLAQQYHSALPQQNLNASRTPLIASTITPKIGERAHNPYGYPSSPQNTAVQPKRIIALEGPQQASELQQAENKKAAYKAFLYQQMAEKEDEKKRLKDLERENDIRLMAQYADQYRIGTKNQGGGSPIRDEHGKVIY